jgi:hypothetical protein
VPNAIKYNTSAETLALKKGNFWIGTGDVGKGPTSSTGYYNGITPPSGGYTIYLNKVSGGPSIYTASNDAQLISLTNSIAGTSYTTANECLVYFAGQTDKMVLNRNYEGIVTDGLVLNLDAGFTPSYPRSGTTWYDVSGSNNGTLTNGPTFNSGDGGGIVFDGVDDYVDIGSNISNYEVFTTSFWINYNFFDSSWRSPLGDNSQVYSYHVLYLGGYIYVGFSSNYSGSPYAGVNHGTINTGTWYNFVITKNSSNLVSFYKNGTLLGTESKAGGTNINKIGEGYVPDNALISLVQFYNRALTATEVLQNYNAQKGRFGL